MTTAVIPTTTVVAANIPTVAYSVPSFLGSSTTGYKRIRLMVGWWWGGVNTLLMKSITLYHTIISHMSTYLNGHSCKYQEKVSQSITKLVGVTLVVGGVVGMIETRYDQDIIKNRDNASSVTS